MSEMLVGLIKFDGMGNAIEGDMVPVETLWRLPESLENFYKLWEERVGGRSVSGTGEMSTRARVESLLGERCMATAKWDEDGVVYTVWVADYDYWPVIDATDLNTGTVPHYQGFEVREARYQFDI